MFQNAIQVAQTYTFPAVISLRRDNGTTESSIGAFMILNDEGWILSASHIMTTIIALSEEAQLHASFQKKSQEIYSDKTLTKAQKKKKIRDLQKPNNKNPTTDVSCWWGNDEWIVNHMEGDAFKDIGIGKINNFNPNAIQKYPVFKNPSVNFNVGENLCKLGYPFYTIVPEYDVSTKRFRLPDGSLPIPRFPIEGIFTRNINAKEKTPDGQITSSATFVETSSPGLRGQRGGPTFDIRGRIWAMQSRTQHFELGFSPKKEQQFLNVGWGVHVKEIISFLRDRNVNIQISDD